jgi:hypothetical protein
MKRYVCTYHIIKQGGEVVVHSGEVQGVLSQQAILPHFDGVLLEDRHSLQIVCHRPAILFKVMMNLSQTT